MSCSSLDSLLCSVFADLKLESVEKCLNAWLQDELSCKQSAFCIMDDEHCFVRVRGRDVLRPEVEMGKVQQWRDIFQKAADIGFEDLPKNLKQITCAIFPSANMSCTLTLHALHGSDNGRLTGLILLQHIVSTGKQSIGSEQIRMHVDVAASLIQLSINMEKKLKEIHFARVILNMFRRVFRNPDQMFHVAEHLCQALKRFVPCDHCKLYWVDNQKNEFVLFTKVVDFAQAFIQQKRFPLNEGILGEAFSNLRMNIATSRRYSNENDSRTAVEPKVDDQNGIIVSPGWTPKDETEKSTNFKNQLLFSIVGNGRIVAIVQVVRKSDAIGFTKVEKQMIKQLQPFFASCISQAKCLSRLHERNRRALLRREPFSLHALRIAEEDVLSLSHWNIRRCENFCADFSRPDYSAQNLTSHEVLKACLIIFADMGFITSFKIDRTTLARFLLALRRSHRNLPYHNWKHAFEMVHFCFILMEKIPEFHELLSDVELISLFIACMCHDIDYRGDSDQLQLVGEIPLSDNEGEPTSTCHNFDQISCILNSRESNILSEMPSDCVEKSMYIIQEALQSTRLSNYHRIHSELLSLCETGIDASNEEHRLLLRSMLMIACHLSHHIKCWKYSKMCASNFFEELFAFGELERAMDHKPRPVMDREKADVVKLQIQCMEAAVLPVFKILGALFPKGKGFYENARYNLLCYEIMGELIQTGRFCSMRHDLSIFTNVDLEKTVIAAASEKWVAQDTLRGQA